MWFNTHVARYVHCVSNKGANTPRNPDIEYYVCSVLYQYTVTASKLNVKKQVFVAEDCYGNTFTVYGSTLSSCIQRLHCSDTHV